jgi:hypothetical protein
MTVSHLSIQESSVVLHGPALADHQLPSPDTFYLGGKILNQAGLDYFYGKNGKTLDLAAAVINFTQGDQVGNLHAKANLGYCYLYGKGCERKPFKGLNLLKEVAQRKCAVAANALAVFELLGGTASFLSSYHRRRKAFEWFSYGASMRDRVCTYNLATCYKFKLGCEWNLREHLKLHDKADYLSRSKDPGLLDELYYQLTKDDGNRIRQGTRINKPCKRKRRKTFLQKVDRETARTADSDMSIQRLLCPPGDTQTQDKQASRSSYVMSIPFLLAPNEGYHGKNIPFHQ